MKKALALLLMTVIFQSCTTEIVKVTPENDKELKGYRFYRPKAYLVVSHDNQEAKKKMDIIYLPDYTEHYSVETGSLDWFTSLDEEDIKIVDGWKLEKLNNIDFKDSETLSLLSDTLELLPGVYEFVFTKQKEFKGIRKVNLLY